MGRSKIYWILRRSNRESALAITIEQGDVLGQEDSSERLAFVDIFMMSASIIVLFIRVKSR